MQYSGDLRKMAVELNDPVDYFMCIGEERIYLNSFIGQTISFTFLGEIHCIQCGRKTSKSFQQGFCYVCMQRINECGNCIIHPERCLVEDGNCPTDDWAHAHCHADQVVYLANTSGLKVGVTRASQVPTRWCDQGAMQALPIFTMKNRYQAGLIEVAMKSYVKDKTNWRTMLKQDSVPLNLSAQRDRLLEEAGDDLTPILERYTDSIKALQSKAIEIHYPVNDYPLKITSLSLDKTDNITAKLLGIKGQYLIFDAGVLNVRKFSGYKVNADFGS